ncbi:M35 family metallo-endopeptidase [Roseateles sp. BYS78W]|uniref:M35 family metallo-endopeptidase n=1 Tax=Pelomonas candidula TaxID=3299025 RepID=A0ABW7HAQ3_9BURK
MDWTLKFKWQYDFAKSKLGSISDFSGDWAGIVAALQGLMGADGFDVSKADSLTALRTKMVQANGKRVSADLGILAAVKADALGVASVPDDPKMRASVLKFLAHTYLVHTSGSRTLWVHSSPKVFLHWPSIHLNSWASTTGEVKTLLKDDREHFSEEDKRNLGASAQHALAWCQKTNAVLSQARSNDATKKSVAMSFVKRWFADPGTTDEELSKYVATLSQGFKDITAMLNKGRLILTDWMPLRNATTDEEIEYLNSEAFTFANNGEGLSVVYIERSFFVNHPGNVLNGVRNWSRILVHELTHLVCGTTDVKKGAVRYAWYGIGPHAGYPGSDAIRNADNWAFFCADCAQVLTEAESVKARKIV